MSLIARFTTFFGLSILSSIVVAEKYDSSMEEYILGRDNVSELLSWVHVNHEGVNWSGRNSVAIAMAEAFVIDQYSGHLSSEVEESCRGVTQAAQSMVMHRQMQVDKNVAREDAEMMSSLDLSLPWPDESESISMLERAYALEVESTQSGKSEQIVFFSAREFEECIKENLH